MNASRNFALPLVALFFGLLLVPRAAMAGAADCPSEPKQGVPILSGDLYAGTNCTLNTPGDIDGFQFAANSGDVWEAVVGINGVVDNNICLTIYDPNGNTVFSGCSSYGLNSFAVLTQQSLTTTGNYSLAVTEEYEGALNYGASLERLYPAPPDGKMVTLGQAVDAEINPVSDQGTYTFVGSSNSKYQASATVLDSDTQNVCLAVFSPTGTSEGSGCTNYGLNSFTVNVQFTPPESGTNVVIVTQGANNSTVNYSVEVSCLSNCTVKTPPCTLKDAVSYNATSKTLTMNFTVGNTSATTWNAWLTDLNSIGNLFSVTQPITNPPVTVTKTTSLSPEGTVGVLSTLTTSTKGIICSSYEQINTGTF